MTEKTIQELAQEAVTSIFKELLNNFSDEPSYKRAMFSQAKRSEYSSDYGCSMVVEVTFVDGDKSANIKTKFGA